MVLGIAVPIMIQNGITENKNELVVYRKAPKFVPAGQSTQMIIGATPENDYQIMSPSKAAEALIDKAKVKVSLLSEFNPTIDLTAEDFDQKAEVEYILVR